MKIFANALALFIALTALTGGIYPVTVTLIGQFFFNRAANGSMIVDNGGRIIASELIGQPFSAPQYFWPRPSATSPFPYNAADSSGSNLAPSNPALHDAITERVKQLREASPERIDTVPVDLVTASGSGLDPHISRAAALIQVSRVAKARSIAPRKLEVLIDNFTEPRYLGVLGEPRVNVFLLNHALDGISEK